jgi:uncharacterized membrane protein required for colicin V production
LLIDIFLTVSILLIFWLGWAAGLTRTFFAVLTGFLSIFAANKYPDNTGIKFYLVFCITALLVIMLGSFTIRVVNFFYLNFLDKILGAVLSVCVWAVIAVNIVIPSLMRVPNSFDTAEKSIVYKTIADAVHSKIFVFKDFKDYAPSFLEDKISKNK